MQHYERKELSEEDIRILEKSPYIKKVSNQRVMYTAEFRSIALESKKNGSSARAILEDLSIDPEILGKSRVASLNANLNTAIRKESDKKSDDPALIRKNKETERLIDKICCLEKQLKEYRQLCQQLYNSAGYFEAESESIKKKSVNASRKYGFARIAMTC